MGQFGQQTLTGIRHVQYLQDAKSHEAHEVRRASIFNVGPVFRGVRAQVNLGKQRSGIQQAKPAKQALLHLRKCASLPRPCHRSRWTYLTRQQIQATPGVGHQSPKSAKMHERNRSAPGLRLKTASLQPRQTTMPHQARLGAHSLCGQTARCRTSLDIISRKYALSTKIFTSHSHLYLPI